MSVRRGRRWDEKLGLRFVPGGADTHRCAVARTGRLAAAGAAPSVGSVGDAYDNALAETVIGLFKTEVIHRD